MTHTKLKKHLDENTRMFNQCIEFEFDKSRIFSIYTCSISMLSFIEVGCQPWMVDIIYSFKEDLESKYYNLLFNK